MSVLGVLLVVGGVGRWLHCQRLDKVDWDAVLGEIARVARSPTFEAAIVTPALTTARQPLAEMGRMAVSC